MHPPFDRSTIYLLSIIASVSTSSSTIAAEEASKSSWKADAELGWISTGGNTDTNSLNAKLNIAKTIHQLVYSTKFDTIRTEENDTETARKYAILAGIKWQPSEKNYFFTNLLHEDDEFSQYDYQTTLTLGYGRPIIANDQYQLDLTIGPGYRYSEFREEIDGESSEQEGVVSVGANFLANLSKTSTFTQDITVDAGEEQVISKSVTAISAKIADSLAMKASISYRHNSDPLPGDANTDRETGITLVYTW